MGASHRDAPSQVAGWLLGSKAGTTAATAPASAACLSTEPTGLQSLESSSLECEPGYPQVLGVILPTLLSVTRSALRCFQVSKFPIRSARASYS
jgi:hypothetical protein